MDNRLTGPARSRSPRQSGTRRPPRQVRAERAPAATQPRPEASAQVRREYDRPGRATTAPRTPFVMLVLGLLGGGLVCLLVINTTLGDASFKISQLQHAGTTLAQQEQSLQREVSTMATPAQLERQAYQLGMRPQSRVRWLNIAKSDVRRRSKPTAHRVRSRTESGRTESGRTESSRTESGRTESGR